MKIKDKSKKTNDNLLITDNIFGSGNERLGWEFLKPDSIF
jgi:hypothetical protein